MSVVDRIAVWGRLVSFSHSVFALPFAVIMIALVARDRSVTYSQVALLILCVVAARTAAMAFNRYVDSDIDAQNPRTAQREIPAGVIARGSALALTFCASGVFIGGAWALGWHCLVLSPLVLIVLLGYSLMKRFSSLCHVVLGVALALAPGGVWYALTGEWSWKPVPLMMTVILWVAGFDILYSCQDAEFDRGRNLFSVPSLVGVNKARAFSAALHLLSLVFLGVNGFVFKAGTLYWVGASIFSMFLLSQHRVVSERGVASIDRVFFTRNGAASVVLCVFVLIDAMLR